MKNLLALLLLCVSTVGYASTTYVGSFYVSDGPDWWTTPSVYSAREAAALIFGGAYTDYAISTNPSLDPTTITFSAYYDGYNEHSGKVFQQDYKFDLTGAGYGAVDAPGSAYSAYVGDQLYLQNYVWKIDPTSPVPEPSTMMMFIAGLGALSLFLRSQRKDGSIVFKLNSA